MLLSMFRASGLQMIVTQVEIDFVCRNKILG